MAAKDALTKSLISRKEFNYSKKGVSLNFTLRTDNTSELRPLEEAIKDIDEILKGMDN